MIGAWHKPIWRIGGIGRRRKRAGFTLVESMIALLLVAGIMEGLYLSMTVLLSATKNGTYRMVAQTLLADKAWQVFSTPNYSTLVSYKPNPETIPVPTNSLLFAAGGTMRIARLAAADNSHCDIIVRLDWVQFVYGHSQAASETYTVTRYNTAR